MQNFSAQLIEEIENSNLDQDIVLTIINELDLMHYHHDDEIVAVVERVFVGVYSNKVDYAYELIEGCYAETGENELLLRYFDYDKFARDLQLGGDNDFIPYKGGCIVINNHEF